MQGFQLIMNFMIMPTFFLSGALYPLGKLPRALAVATRIDPLSYGIDGLRGDDQRRAFSAGVGRGNPGGSGGRFSGPGGVGVFEDSGVNPQNALTTEGTDSPEEITEKDEEGWTTDVTDGHG